MWLLTKPTATEPVDVVVGFEAGVPVSLDGEALSVLGVVQRLNDVVGSYGWGRIDMVENRRVGIKSRETYECPASLALILAHRDLEGICLERDLQREKARLEPRYAELIYDGLWFSPLKQALDAFIAESQRYVTGEVRLHLVARAPARSPGGGARTASTTTAWPPTTPTTASATRTRPASSACGACRSRPGPAPRGTSGTG